MSNSPAEHRRRIAQMRVDEGAKKKWNPPKDGPAKGNAAFGRKNGEPLPPRHER